MKQLEYNLKKKVWTNIFNSWEKEKDGERKASLGKVCLWDASILPLSCEG